MAIDYGKARIGVAISDPLGMTARGIETLNWNGRDMEWALDRISELAAEHQIIELVMGLPKRTDGQSSESEEQAKLMATRLETRLAVPILLRDERYTTVLASRVLNEVNFKKDRKRQVIDQVAAEIILQDYLNNAK